MTDLSTDEVLFSDEGAATPEGVRKILGEIRRAVADEDAQKRLRRRQPEYAGITGHLRRTGDAYGLIWRDFGEHETWNDQAVYEALVQWRENNEF